MYNHIISIVLIQFLKLYLHLDASSLKLSKIQTVMVYLIHVWTYIHCKVGFFIVSRGKLKE